LGKNILFTTNIKSRAFIFGFNIAIEAMPSIRCTGFYTLHSTVEMPDSTVEMLHSAVEMPDSTVEMPDSAVEMLHSAVEMLHSTVEMPDGTS